MNEEAIQHYHELLARMSAPELVEMRDKFLNDLRLNKASYGGRLLTKYLRPKFLTRAQMKTIREVCTILRNVVIKVKDAFFEDEGIRRAISLTDEERRLTDIYPGFSRICVTSRWDSFWAEEGLKFVELNAESPAGVAYTDVMSQIYFELPVLKEFMKTYHVEPFYVREVLLHAFLVTYLSWEGNKSQRQIPNVAVVDWSDVPTFTEFELVRDYFDFHGVPTVIADPRELEYRNGRLCKGDFEIDLVYRRVLTNEIIERLDEVKPMLRAYEDHNVCFINSFRSKMIHKKSLFAILSDPRNERYFTDYEREIITRHIPWTRVIGESKADLHGETIDLLDYVSQHKDRFVIKPNDEYGGEGVLIGREATPEEWHKRLHGALSDVHVVQEVVPLARELFPYVDEGLEFDNLLVDLDPYLFGVNTAGCLTRLSGSSLANVTAGGGATVTFLIDRK